MSNLCKCGCKPRYNFPSMTYVCDNIKCKYFAAAFYFEYWLKNIAKNS